VPVDPAVARFLKAFYPLPNAGALGGDLGKFIFAEQQVTTENYFTTKIDHKFSERDSISGTYSHDNSIVVQPDAFGELLSNVVSRRQLVTLHEQHNFNPRVLNAARVGYNRAVAIEGGVTRVINPLLTDPSYGFVPGQFAGYLKGVPGLTDFNGAPDATHPRSLSSARDRFWNSFQWADDVFLTRGVHALQFGVVAERMQDNTFAVTTADGGFKFGSLADLLTNRPLNFQAQLPGPVATFGVRETLFGAYAQDDIRVRPGLSLSLGVRYEMSTVPAEAHNRLSNLDRLTDAQPRLGAPFFLNPTLHNFEPRVGLAWSPTAENKTIVRAGFGIFDVLPLPYEFSLTIPSITPFRKQIFPEFLPPGTFPTGAFQQFAGSANTFRAGYTEHDPKRNYVLQWNLNLQRELPGRLTATLGYVGSHGVHQPYRVDNIDMVLPTGLTPAGYVFPSPDTSSTLNPNFGRISATLWQASSSYHALQAVIAKNLSHGVQFHGAYTWGKSIDTLSATVANDAFPNGILNPLFFDQHKTRGLSDFDVGQNFVVNLSWQTPAPRTNSKLAGWALSGWQLGGIFKASTGQPFTPLLGGDPLGLKLDETNEPLDRVVGPGCETLSNPGNPNHYIKTQCLALPKATPAIASQCTAFGFRLPGTNGPTDAGSPGMAGTCANRLGNLGRNTVIGPGLANLDFSLFKNNRIRRISENFNVQFRAEFFNVFNRANFASPTDNRTVFDQTGSPISSAGLIDSTQTPSRQIQFALKLIW
jgi:hypothetical protein